MRTINRRSATIAVFVTLILATLIYLGSAGLTYFDSALIGYATASLHAWCIPGSLDLLWSSHD